jgi:hypothetical protein
MDEKQALSRRAALQGLASGLGAALAATADAAEAHPVSAHIAQRVARPIARTTPRPSSPRFLDPHQFATLSIVADLIVPGARASDSPQFIDEVLAIERPAVQQRFLGALGALDAAARDQYQQSFKSLTADRQTAVLEAATGQTSEGEAVVSESPADPERAKPTGARAPLRDPVSYLKTWIAGAHYSSEAGMKELGWTGAMFFPAFPGCTHPNGHE